MINSAPKLSLWKKFKKKFFSQLNSKEALRDLLRDAQSRAVIDEETLAMLEGSLAFSELKVRDIMLPKKQIVSIDERMTLEEIIKIVSESGHSRFPVVAEHIDDVVGILHAKDLLRFYHTPVEQFKLRDLIRQATVVPESKRLDSLLHEFRLQRNHMAIVVDEYGTLLAFATLEDIIEQIIGDIEDEFDVDEEANIKQHSDGHFIIKAHTPIEEFNELLKAQFSEEHYNTIAGIIMSHFGHLPKPNDRICIKGFEFKIISADARRIQLIDCIDLRPKIELDITADKP